jgi:hypothetical protein
VSGPKIDYVELERRRKAELERIRQERLRKIREETDRLNTAISKTKAQIDHIDRHLLLLARNVEYADEMALTVSMLKELKTAYKTQLAKALEINVPTEPDGISACTSKLADITKSVMENYFNEVKPLEERIRDYNKQLEIQNTVVSTFKDFSAEKEEIKNIEDFDFTVRMDNVTHSDIEITVKERASQILVEIEDLVNSESIQEYDMIKLNTIANNIYKTAFETKASFEAAAIEYKVMKPSVVKNIAIFDDVYHDYYAEYVVYVDSINKNKINPISIMPKEKYDFASIEELQEETALLAQESKIAMERNYIREQIDEVMDEFGYNVSDEIILDVNQTGSHYICGNKSGQSAIHVHISDKKQVMMEIVGIGESAAVSNNGSVNGIITASSDLSDSERNNLLSEQGGFCEIHPKIVDELRKRDVILNAKSRKLPDLKYCKKITPVTAGKDTVIAQSELINEHAAERRRSKGMKAKLREMK